MLLSPSPAGLPAYPRARVARLAADLAARGIYLGTSSWKYEGWLGQLYDPARYAHRGKFAKSRFERDCLEEYAATLKSVCVDAAYYAFPRADWLARLAAQVPDDFRFSFKVTEEVTVKRYPQIARLGPRAGQENPRFLDPACFEDAFLGPMEAIRPQVGCLVFEFSTVRPSAFARGRDFVEALDGFFAKVPRGWRYGVEIRNANFLRPEYFAVLRRHGVAHVFNAWERMPPVAEQLALPDSGTASFVAARFLLSPGRRYADAVEAFSPYDRTRSVDEGARAALAALARAERPPPDGSFIYVNNRLEGSALWTLASLLPSGG